MRTAIITTIAALSIACTCMAEKPDRPEREGKRRVHPELRKIHQEHRAARRDHHKAKREAIEAFHAEMKEVPAEERLGKIIAFREEQQAEGAAFHDALHNRLVAAINAAESIPAEKKQEILARTKLHYTEAKAFHEGLYADVMAFLKELQASDAPIEEKMKAWRTFHQEILAKRDEWRKEHRPERAPGRRGRGGPKRDRPGQEA